LQEHEKENQAFGLVCANFDTELFGHWWFEGVDWIEGVLRHLAGMETVELTTASTFLEAHPPQTAIHLPEGSWGAGGNHFVWDNADTHWMWPMIHDAEGRMLRAVQSFSDADQAEKEVLNQAGRELLLLQSSDWPFLVSTGQAGEYAIQRFRQHVERFDQLMSSLENGSPDVDAARKLWERDKIFPDMDYRWYAA
jgi:1,4-alpha-glucan branching enzyme